MSRPKLRENRGLPQYLTYDCTRQKYRYTNPQTKKRTYISDDRKASIDAANKLNAELMPAVVSILERVASGGGRGKQWRDVIDTYLSVQFPRRRLAPKTRSQYQTYFLKLRDCSLAQQNVSAIRVVELSSALESLTTGKRMHDVYRLRAIEVFDFALSRGWREGDNPARIVYERKPERARERLDQAGYDSVYSVAEPWLQVAMDLALITLQRREDVSNMRYEDVRDGHLFVIQSKTQARLQIRISDELRAVIEASRDDLEAPHIVHREPGRRSNHDEMAQGRTHVAQVLGEQIGKGFRLARDKCGHFKDSEYPPTFHEIRSFGGDRYRQMGWSNAQIQALYGHTSAKMTGDYLEGHEPPWTPVG